MAKKSIVNSRTRNPRVVAEAVALAAMEATAAADMAVATADTGAVTAKDPRAATAAGTVVAMEAKVS